VNIFIDRYADFDRRDELSTRVTQCRRDARFARLLARDFDESDNKLLADEMLEKARDLDQLANSLLDELHID
jgi:hypothetical protein